MFRIAPHVRPVVGQVAHFAREPTVHPIPKTREIRHGIRRRNACHSEAALGR
jgi:hypothetical protein